MSIVIGDGNTSERHSANEAIGNALSSIFGEAQKTATLHGIEQRFQLRLEQLADRPDEFVEALDQIFGLTVASTLVRLVLRELRKKKQRENPSGGLTLLSRFEEHLFQAQTR